LIEGAHLGHGLGVQFLRHIERCRLLLHLIDVSAMSEKDPIEGYQTIEAELAEHDPKLVQKPMIIVATKLDAVVPEKLEKLERWSGQNDVHMIKISSVTGEGLEELKHQVFLKLSEHEVQRRS
jgi:GTP-binding protein